MLASRATKKNINKHEMSHLKALQQDHYIQRKDRFGISTRVTTVESIEMRFSGSTRER